MYENRNDIRENITKKGHTNKSQIQHIKELKILIGLFFAICYRYLLIMLCFIGVHTVYAVEAVDPVLFLVQVNTTRLVSRTLKNSL